MDRIIDVQESIYRRNEDQASILNAELTAAHVFAVNVMGAPGVGKTSVLAGIIPLMRRRAFVIEGDIQSDIDTRRLQGMNIHAIQINTGGACHLDTPLIARAVEQMKPQNGVLFIENIGNLVCPAEFMIGEHIKLLIVSVTDGGDKPYKYPLAFEKADLVLINKWDLKAHTDFDETFFLSGLRALNPDAPVFRVSCRIGAGLDEVAAWIQNRADAVTGA